jgi:hypothetical protein
MKPTLPKFQPSNRRDSHAGARTLPTFPQTDFCFRPDSRGEFGGHGHGTPRPSFRGISEEYFKTEARGHFANEAAIFCLMAVTAAVPVIEGIRGAAHVLREFGIL